MRGSAPHPAGDVYSPGFPLFCRHLLNIGKPGKPDKNGKMERRRVKTRYDELKEARQRRAAQQEPPSIQEPPEEKPEKKPEGKNEKGKRNRKRTKSTVKPFLSVVSASLGSAWYKFLIVFCLLLGLSYLFFLRPNSYNILINDEPIAAIGRNYNITQEEFLEIISASMESTLNTPVFPRETVTFRPTNTRENSRITMEQAIMKISGLLNYYIEGGLLIIDGQGLFSVASVALAEEIVRNIAQSYIHNDSTLINAEGTNLIIEPVLIDPETVISPNHAMEILTAATRTIVPHVVQWGESYWSLAMSAGTTPEELMALNSAEINDDLMAGQIILLPLYIPLLDVETLEAFPLITNIAPGVEQRRNSVLPPGASNLVQQGIPGQMQETYHITRLNGREISRILISTEYLTAPVPYIIETAD